MSQDPSGIQYQLHDATVQQNFTAQCIRSRAYHELGVECVSHSFSHMFIDNRERATNELEGQGSLPLAVSILLVSHAIH